VLSHAAGIARGLRAEERAARAPVGRETRFACFSAGKPVVALALALLEQRGRLDPSAPVAAYFPEFAAHGKGAITVDDVLTHRAGVLLPELCTRPADWPHPDRVRAALVAARPVHPRGGLAYAPLEYGWILGEVLERIDGRPLPRFVAEEIARPAGLDALGFGAVAHERARVARSYWLGPARLVVAGANVAATFEEANNSDDFFAANLPGSGLVANAESLAAFYDLLLPSACVPGRPRLVDDARLRAWTARRAFGWDRSNRAPLAVGRGVLLGTLGPSAYGWWGTGRCFGHAGAFGVLGFADPERALSVAIVTNAHRGRRELLRDLTPLAHAIRRATPHH
jgi:CubicO group peptidase (beta-lactamase class C family)